MRHRGETAQAQRTPDRGETFDRFAMLPPDLADKGLIDIDRVLGDKNLNASSSITLRCMKKI